MGEPEHVVILVTTATLEDAQQIGGSLLEQRQAACVNIIPGVVSRFWWQGKLDTAQESLLIIKTRAGKLPEIIDSVKRMHRYDVPEIIALPVVGGNPDYLNWIDKEVK